MALRNVAILLPAFLTWACSSAPSAGFADDLTDAGPETAPIYLPPPAWSGGSPVLLAKNQEAVSLALDDAHVYWQGPGGSVFACPLGGCPDGRAAQLSSLVGPSSEALQTLGASGGDAVFLSDNGDALTILAVGDPGRASTMYAAAADGGSLGLLVNDAANVYFVAVNGVCAPTQVLACPLGGPCASPVTLYESASTYIGQLSVAGSEVFFVQSDEAGDYAIHAVSAHGGGARKVCSLGTDYAGVVDMIVAGGFVYVTTSNNPTKITACAASGSSNAWTYVEDLEPYALATDGENLYWTNYQAEGNVVTCALGKECTSPFTVASNQTSPFAIVANGSSVFWSTQSSILRADK